MDEVVLVNPILNQSGSDLKQGSKSKKKRNNKIEPVIRSELLPPGWPKYTAPNQPQFRFPGLGAWLSREMVARTYRQSIYKNRVDLKKLNQDERFGCASTIWRRVFSELQYQGVGPDRTSGSELSARRMFGCFPPGYRIASGGQGTKKLRACSELICPFCYARKVVKMFSDLDLAFRRRPEGSKIWISPFYLVDDKKLFLGRLKKLRPACAVAFFHPVVGTLDDHDVVSIRGVMLTDDKGRVESRRYKRRVYNSKNIAKALSVWMTYPTAWYKGTPIKTAREMVKLSCALPKNAHRYATYGVCRNDCVPGKSLFDFAAYDKGGVPPELIAGYHTRERAKRCESSPTSGSSAIPCST